MTGSTVVLLGSRWCRGPSRSAVDCSCCRTAAAGLERGMVTQSGCTRLQNIRSVRGRGGHGRRVASAIAHWAPRFTANGVTAADFARVTAAVQRWPQWCAAWVEVAERARAARPCRRRRRAGCAPPGSTWPRPRRTTTSPSSSSSRTYEQMRSAHARGGRLRTPTRCPTSTRRAAASRCPSRAPGWSASSARPPARGPSPSSCMIPGLDSTKEELRSTEQTFLARGLATFSSRRPRSGGVGVRPADPRRLGAGGRGGARRGHRAARPRRGPARGVGRQPGRLLLRRAWRLPWATGSGPPWPWPGRSASGSAGTGCPP